MTDWIESEGVDLVITAFQAKLQERSVNRGRQKCWGSMPDRVLVLQLDLNNPKVRDDQAREAFRRCWMTIRSGASVLVHCMAGVHRAPVAAAVMLAFLQWSVERCMAHVSRLRAVSYEEALQETGRHAPKRGQESLKQWLHRISRDMRAWQLKRPLQVHAFWVAQSGTRVHAVHRGEPVCKWKKSAGEKVFVREPMKFDNLRDALALQNATFCKDCRMTMPAKVMAELRDFA